MQCAKYVLHCITELETDYSKVPQLGFVYQLLQLGALSFFSFLLIPRVGFKHLQGVSVLEWAESSMFMVFESRSLLKS